MSLKLNKNDLELLAMTYSNKEQLYKQCVSIIEVKLNTINSVFDSAQDSANNETKSTAGDKHDTARAMAHLESEKNAKQLIEINKLKKVLPYIKNHKNNGVIELGSIVKTDGANYYISISLGKLKIEAQDFYCISAVTPIGRLLIGKTIGDTILFHGNSITILELL
jgi:transcription elongation GreA/GreB family factor